MGTQVTLGPVSVIVNVGRTLELYFYENYLEI